MVACVVAVVSMVAAISLAIPKLAASGLQPSSTELLWIVDVYVLVFGCLLIPVSTLGGRLGRKGVLLCGLATFVVGCVASAAAPSVEVLVAGRVITGVGAALMMPGTLSLLLQVTPPPRLGAPWLSGRPPRPPPLLRNRRGRTRARVPPVGRLFIVVAPLTAVLSAWLSARDERHHAELDPVGSGLLVTLVFPVLLGIIEGPQNGWDPAFVLGAFVLCAAFVVGFVLHGLRATQPVRDPRLLRIPLVRVGSTGILAAFLGLFACSSSTRSSCSTEKASRRCASASRSRRSPGHGRRLEEQPADHRAVRHASRRRAGSGAHRCVAGPALDGRRGDPLRGARGPADLRRDRHGPLAPAAVDGHHGLAPQGRDGLGAQRGDAGSAARWASPGSGP